MQVTTMGIDLAKQVFQVHGIDTRGIVLLKKRLTRSALRTFMANLPSCRVGMEVCGGANYWSRQFRAYGHDVRLMSPQFVKPYVKSNKNDCNDAEAICEAVSRPTMRFVAPKTVAQQDLQGLHRIRQRLVQSRTALINQIRGLLAEYGITVPQQAAQLRRRLPVILEDPTNELMPLGRELFGDLARELAGLNERITQVEARIKHLFAENEVCQRLAQVEGVGPLIATAMVAAVSDPRAFKNGRQLAAWLGLVPRQRSSGNTHLLLGISKRGDRYLRTLLIHGARSVVARVPAKKDSRSRWIVEIQRRRGTNRTCVAVANKNARILWALMAKGEMYRQVA
jgi:transposase